MSSPDERLKHLDLLLQALLHQYGQFRSGSVTEVAYLRACCQSVGAFFFETGAPPESANAFMALTRHLDGLLAKRESSLVGMAPTAKARPRTEYRQFLIAMASACMDVLMEPGGNAKTRAAEVVARQCSSWPGIGDPTKITPTTIVNWRDGFLQGSTVENAEFNALCAAFRQEADPLGKVSEILQFGPPSGPGT